MQEQPSVMQCRCACAVDAVRLGLSGFRKVARLHGSKPCHESFDGSTPKSKLHHPIKICGSRGSSVQCTSHATIVLLNINIWLYIHIYLTIHISGSVAQMIDRCWLVALCSSDF